MKKPDELITPLTAAANAVIEDSNGHEVAYVDGYGCICADDDVRAAYIVHCVNCHETLVEMARETMNIIEQDRALTRADKVTP